MGNFLKEAVINLLLWGFLLMLIGALYSFTPFWRVTDPHDPKFVAEDFRYEDYGDEKKLQDALRVMFPVGTPKRRVDFILYENLLHGGIPETTKHSGAWIEKVERLSSKMEGEVWGYFYKKPFSMDGFIIAIYAHYDARGKLMQLSYFDTPLLNKE